MGCNSPHFTIGPLSPHHSARSRITRITTSQHNHHRFHRIYSNMSWFMYGLHCISSVASFSSLALCSFILFFRLALQFLCVSCSFERFLSTRFVSPFLFASLSLRSQQRVTFSWRLWSLAFRRSKKVLYMRIPSCSSTSMDLYSSVLSRHVASPETAYQTLFERCRGATTLAPFATNGYRDSRIEMFTDKT